jgi:hypothetical protein
MNGVEEKGQNGFRSEWCEGIDFVKGKMEWEGFRSLDPFLEKMAKTGRPGFEDAEV